MEENWILPLRQVSEKKKDDQSIVWNHLRLSYEQKLFGQVSCMTYNHSGTLVGCTSSNQFALLRVPQSDGVVVNQQSDRSIFSVRFRSDDKLFIQCVDKRVCIKSPDTAFERQFLGHTRDVHCAEYLGTHNFVSGSDDTTLKLWDILRDTELMSGGAHTDYVRSLEPYTSGSFFSGSYDHTVQLWDPRVGLGSALQHSKKCITQAVEALCFIPAQNVLACAAGDQLILFDTRKGISAPMLQVSCHTKTITSVVYSSEYKTLITGSLDNRVKMFSLKDGDLNCLTTKRFDHSITAVAVHPLSKEFCVGMGNGDMKIFKVQGSQSVAADSNTDVVTDSFKNRIDDVLSSKMKVAQHQLKTFSYGKALKTALFSRKSDVIMSTLEELIRRGALHIALSNQNDRSVAQIIRFAISQVDVPQFTNTAVSVLEDIFEIYGSCVGHSLFLHREVLIARKRLGAALESINRMEKLQGVMEFILSQSV